MENYEYILSLRDNVSGVLNNINNNANRSQGVFSALGNGITSIGKGLGAIGLAVNGVKAIYDSFSAATEPARKFETAMADIKASTGVNADQLKQISDNARELGKRFGVDIAEGVGATQVLLSKLTPDLAKFPDQLKAMTEQTMLLAKANGNDLAGSVNMISDVLNAYGVTMDGTAASADNMVKVSKNASDMLVGSFKAGSATVASMSNSLQNVGGAAASAGVSFGQMLAQFQVMDTIGLRNAEAGTSFKEILNIMMSAKHASKELAAAYKAAGVDVNLLSDPTVDYGLKLKEVNKMTDDQKRTMGGSAHGGTIVTITSTAGIEKYNEQFVAAKQAADATAQYAAITMATFDETVNRGKALWQDFVIEIWNGSSPLMDAFAGLKKAFAPVIEAISNALGLGEGDMKSFVASVIGGISSMIKFISSMIEFITPAISLIMAALEPFIIGLGVMLNFIIDNSSWLGVIAVALGVIPALIWAINIAMAANPLVLIVAGIALVIGLVVMAYQKFETFRNIVDTVGDVGGKVFNGIVDAFKSAGNYITELIDKVRDFFGLAKSGISDLKNEEPPMSDAEWNDRSRNPEKYASTMGNSLSGAGGFLSDKLDGFVNGAKTLLDKTGINKLVDKGKDVFDSKKEIDIFAKGGGKVTAMGTPEAKKTNDAINGGGNKPTNITIRIEKFQDNIQLYSTTVTEGAERIKEILEEELLRVVNGAQQKIA